MLSLVLKIRTTEIMCRLFVLLLQGVWCVFIFNLYNSIVVTSMVELFGILLKMAELPDFIKNIVVNLYIL